MQSSGQCFSVEFAALAAEDRADNSEVLKLQREGIRTRRSRFSLWCKSKRVYARVKMMGFELRHFFELYSMMFVRVARLPAMRLSSANWKRSSSDVTSSAPRFN
jgi:hypothetical protein